MEREKKFKEFYEKKHEESTKYFELYIPLKLNQYLSASNILDLGSGQQVRNVSKDKNRVVYSDISVNALKMARKDRPTANFIVLDAQNLPFKNNSFNSILCKDIFEHVPSDKQTVGEVYRCLAKNGTVGVWAPSILFERDIREWGHLRAYNIEKLSKLFKDFKLIYYAPTRTWKERKIFRFIIVVIVKVLSFLPWQKIREYQKLKKEFSINKFEYVLCLYEKYIDRLFLKMYPSLGTNIIAVYKK